MLGDIFSGIAANRDVKVAPAPAPGRHSHFDHQTLSALARRHDVGWRPASDFEKTSVMRSYQTVTAEEILAAVRTSDYFSAKLSGDEVFESRTLQNIAIAEGVEYSLRVADAYLEPKNNSFRAEVNVIGDGRVLETARIVGRVLVMAEVPVLKKSLSAGAVISEHDIEHIRMRSDVLNHKTITDASSLVGKEAKRTLKPGQTLTDNDVKTPVLVTKSKMVSVIYKKKNMTLSHVGKALENGSMGDFIRFQPSGGTSVLQGEVVDVNTVMVSSNATGRGFMKELE